MESIQSFLQQAQVQNWTLFSLILLPVVFGTLTWLCGDRDKLRRVLVWSAAVVIFAGGLLTVWQSMGGKLSENVWELTLPARYANIGFALESLILLVILAVAIRIRNVWITVFAVIQAAFAIGGHFLHGGAEAQTLTLFRIDNLSRILLLVTSVVGSAIMIFAMGYMKEHMRHLYALGRNRAPKGAGTEGRFFFFFISFLGFMIGLVTSNNFSFFSAFWEATTLCSYALIGQDGGDARRINATRALLINSFGGVLLLGGIFILKYNGLGEDFQTMFQHNASALTLLPAVLLCMAAFTKSALFPFQSWLLGAMVAPTPVSALLHAATMVKAGVYLVMRLTPNYSQYSSFMMMIAFAGALSFAGAAFLACTQTNAKKVLAYSTISNLGLVVACAGIESPLAYAAGLSIITFHAISKGLLFLCVGRIEQKIGSRDIEKMDGMPHRMFFTTCVALIGMMSMLLPPFGMLLSKWLAIEATIKSPFLLVFMVIGSAFTVYFWAKWMGHMQLTGYHENTPKEDIPGTMKISLSILAFLVIATGIVTMMIFSGVFTHMAKEAFPLMTDALSRMTAEQASFPAWMVLTCLFAGLIFAGLLSLFVLKKQDIRPPYLCGENAISIEEEQNPEMNRSGVKSYDFYSVGGKVEHAVFASYYFTKYISEDFVTKGMNWFGWLVLIVLFGCAVANIH